MTDFLALKHGAVVYPLPLAGAGLGGQGATLLRDADPALYYMLEFFASCIETHLGARVLQEVALAGMAPDQPGKDFEAAVSMALPINPQAFLNEEHMRFPLLAIWRERRTFEYVGQRKVAVDQVNLAYILPPLDAFQAEKLMPTLHAVGAIIDNRSEQGFDPAYTPSAPTGTPGEPIWAANRAGLKSIEVKSIEFGDYPSVTDLSFPGLSMKIEVKERSEAVTEQLVGFDGVTTTTELQGQPPAEDPTPVPVAEQAHYAAPALLSMAPTTGSKAGGTPAVITGTGFIVGRRYRVLFNGCDASSVTAESTTTLSCITPQYPASPTAAVNVRVIDQDGGLSNVLSTAFTFTTP